MSKYAASVTKYVDVKKEKDRIDRELEAAKQAFYKDMDEYFKRHRHDTSIEFRFKQQIVDRHPCLRVQKIEPSSVEFDAARLTKVLGKKRARKVIRKTYTIIDWEGFTALMKEHGVEPKEVAKLLNVEAKVDQKALEQLDAVGELDDVDSADLVDCSKVIKRARYYKVTEVNNAY